MTIKRSTIGFFLIWTALVVVASTVDTQNWRWAWWVFASIMLSFGLDMYVTGKVREGARR